MFGERGVTKKFIALIRFSKYNSQLQALSLKPLSWYLVLLTGLSVSIGWGVRGQFGHEYGAALAGALGGMTIALLSGREDWRRRIHYFAFLGAVGFGFGGAMSYMKTVAYAHSSDSKTVLYGFFCLFVLGLIWAAPAGAGIAIAAYFPREELTKFFVPICAVFLSWYAHDAMRMWTRDWPRYQYVLGGQGGVINLTILVVIVVCLIRRQYWGLGSRLMLYMAGGWWAGNILLIRVLHIDMNPPRGDTWAGYLGLVFGIVAFCWRNKQGGIAFATIATGFLGGVGFALGTAVKLIVMSSGFNTNWHSVMEQTQGFFLGIALAITLGLLIGRAPTIVDEPRTRRWTEVFSVVFVLCVLPYLNFRRSPGEWTKEIEGLTDKLYGISISADLMPSRGFVGWLDFVFIALGFAMILLLILHLKKPIPLIPESWTGKGQLFYLVFLWTIVVINFAMVLPRFTPIRLVTEWFMTLNAIACTVLLVYACFARSEGTVEIASETSYSPWIRNAIVFGLMGAAVVSCAGWSVKKALYGDRFAGLIYQDQIRFGPNNTNTVR
jgi:hypothetical protein